MSASNSKPESDYFQTQKKKSGVDLKSNTDLNYQMLLKELERSEERLNIEVTDPTANVQEGVVSISPQEYIRGNEETIVKVMTIVEYDNLLNYPELLNRLSSKYGSSALNKLIESEKQFADMKEIEEELAAITCDDDGYYLILESIVVHCMGDTLIVQCFEELT